MVVVPVHDVYELLRPFAFGDPVKQEAVGQVFKKCPEKHASEVEYYGAQNRKTLGIDGIKRESDNKRKVYAPDHQRICLCEHFQVRITEQLRLSFVVNFIKLHASQFALQK